MLNRREFVYGTLAGVLALTRGPRLFAQGFDVVVKGGRVIDPSLRVNALLDVAVAGGRIAAVGADIAPGGADVLDATGKLVVPGLLDVHAHYGRDADGPHICLSDGVTGWVDAGTAGADGIDEVVAIVRAAPQPARALINIGRQGVIDDGDTHDLALADIEAAKAAIARNREYVVGVKARLTAGVTADDAEVLRRAEEVASYFDLPVMIHMGQTSSPISMLVDLLKPGDIVTHMFAPPPNAILDGDGRIFEAVLAARRRGVWFDVANGRVDHIRWDTYDRIMATGFWPDTISTDGSTTSREAPSVVDFPNVLSKFLNFGMTVDEAVARATVNASRVYPFMRDRGTLNVGAPADVAVLELREGSFDFVDNYENVRTGTRRLFPFETLLGGRRAPRV